MRYLNILFAISLLLIGQINQTYAQIEACFSADNCYAIYVGDENGVNQKVSPQGSSTGIVNTTAAMIFTPECLQVNAGSDDWFYIIAWSDDSRCQGLIGEFTGNQTLRTGDVGWQMLATGHDFDPQVNTGPSKNLINSKIASAGQPNTPNWKPPHVGPANGSNKSACRLYPAKLNGISTNAKWVWNNKTGVANPFQGSVDHDEFLIFRFPIAKIITDNTTKPTEYEICCPPIAKEDLANMLTVNGNLSTYKPKFKLSSKFKKRLQAYIEYRTALDPCFRDFTIEYVIRRPESQPRGFAFTDPTRMTRGATVFHSGQPTSTWGQADLSNTTLQTNQWYRLDVVFYGNPSSCSNWNTVEKCGVTLLEFNIMTHNMVKSKKNFSGSIAQFGKIK